MKQKGFLGFGKIFSFIAYFGLFFGVISGTATNVLRIVATPGDPEVWKRLIIDMAKTVSNSQGELSETVKNFPEIAETGFGDLAIAKIFGCILITLALIYIFYKLLRKLKPAPSTTDLIMIFLISIFFIWFVGVVASFITGDIKWFPFGGFVDLAIYRENIINYILAKYTA